jgi:hypothetical protein
VASHQPAILRNRHSVSESDPAVDWDAPVP